MSILLGFGELINLFKGIVMADGSSEKYVGDSKKQIFDEWLSELENEDWSLEEGVVPNVPKLQHDEHQRTSGVLSERRTCEYIIPDIISSLRSH